MICYIIIDYVILYVCICMYVCIYIYIYIYIYTHIHNTHKISYYLHELRRLQELTCGSGRLSSIRGEFSSLGL